MTHSTFPLCVTASVTSPEKLSITWKVNPFARSSFTNFPAPLPVAHYGLSPQLLYLRCESSYQSHQDQNSTRITDITLRIAL